MLMRACLCKSIILLRHGLLKCPIFSRSFPDPTHDEHVENIQADVSQIKGALLAAQLPSLTHVPEEASRPFDHSSTYFHNLDFSSLLSTREAHETERARKSVRTQMHQHQKATNHDAEVPIRRHIIREMNSILREQQDQGGGTGLERKNRWAPGGRSGQEVARLVGNSANAELAAGQRAATVRTVLLTSQVFDHDHTSRSRNVVLMSSQSNASLRRII
jgi:hypothetical protein